MYGDVAIVVYSGQYVENGVKKNFLPDNTMVLGNTQARGLRTYGCIQDADAQREGINASARYPKNWVTTGDPAREFTMIQSAPLMLLAALMSSCPYNWRNHGPSGPLFFCGGVHDER